MAAESEPIKGADIIDPDALLKIINDARTVIELTDQMILGFKKLAAQTGAGKNSSAPTNIKDLNDEYILVAKVNEITKANIATKAAYNKAVKEERDAVAALASPYKSLSVEYGKALQAAKDSAAADIQAKRAMSAETQKLIKISNEYNDQLKKIDFTLGNHQRNVGNYNSTLGTVGKSLKGFGALGGILSRALGVDPEVFMGIKEAGMALKDTKHVMEGVEHAKEGQVAVNTELAASNEAVAVSEEAMLGPIGWALLGITALTGGIALWVEQSKYAREEEDKRSKALDGSIVLDKERREQINQNIIKISELADKYKVLSGAMSESEAAINSLVLNNTEKLDKLDKDTDAKLTDAISIWQKAQFYFVGTVPSLNREEEDVIHSDQKLRKQQEQILAQQVLNSAQEETNKILDERIKRDNTIAGIENSSIKDNERREKNKLLLEHSLAIAELAISTEDERIKMEKKKTINSEYYANLLKIEEDYEIKHKEQLMTDLVEFAKTTNNKLLIENALYEKQSADLKKDQEARHATDEERKLEDESLEKQHQDNLTKIVREKEDEDRQIREKSFQLIQNNTQRELALATDTKDKELEDAQRRFDDGLDNLDQFNAKKLNAEKEYQLSLKKIQDETTNKTNADNTKKAGLKTQSDTLAGAGPQTILNDDIAQENSRWKEEFDKAVQNANTTYQEMENIEQEHENNLAAIRKKAFDKQLEEIVSESKTIINAIGEGLQQRANMLQAADQRDIDQHTRLMNAQAALAAGGRANSLAAEEAEAEKAEEKKIQDAKKAQREQEAVQLANIVLELTAAYAKAGNTNNPEFKALTVALAAKGIAAAIGGYATGVENLEGPGTTTSDSIVARLSKGESVATAKATAENPGLVTAMNKGNVEDYFKNIYIPNYNAANLSASGILMPSANEEMIEVFTKEIRDLKNTIESKPTQITNLGRLGEWTETIIRNNNKTIIHHLKRGGRPRI